MTKNNKMWLRGLIATVVNGFASGMVLIIADPVAFNLDSGLRKLVMTSAVFALFGLANYLKQHPLPDDEDVVTLRGFVLPLLLVSGLASGCALGGAVVTPPPPGGPTAEQVQAVRNEAAKLATATKEAATLAVNARRLVQSGFEAGLVSRDALQKVNDASIVVSQKGIAFVNFAETVTTDPSLRVTATELLKIFDDYIVALSGAGQSGAAIRTALAVLRAYLGVQ